MDYDQFLETLSSNDWTVPNRSFACKILGNGWQVAFVRMGGKYQRPGKITFVVCVRSMNLRNLDGERNEIEKEPHSYPFKFTFDDIRKHRFKYQCKLNNYELSEFGIAEDWSEILRAIEIAIPTWLNTYSQTALAGEIAKKGEDGYIERIWIEDLSSAE